MDKFKQRELYLHDKALKTSHELLPIYKGASVNIKITFELIRLQLIFNQKYRVESKYYYVSKKDYNADLHKIEYLEAGIVEGPYKAQAVQAVAETKEYLSLIAEYRIRNNKKCRVY